MARSVTTFATRCLALAGAVGSVITITTGCTTTVTGTPASPLYDPYTVAGLPAADGPSGVRADAPQTTGKVVNSNGSDADHVALLGVNDVEDFWTQTYNELPGTFKPVSRLISYDSKDPASPPICGADTFKEPNAFFCPPRWLMAWDRGALVPTGQKYFGDAAIAGLISHEYGHAVQQMAGLVDKTTPTLVREQQADCFGGSYLRWLAEGKSPRFTMSTGDGLNHILAAVIVTRDPILTPDLADLVDNGHGTALDRVSAVQIGFVDGVSACAKVTMNEIQSRRGGLPIILHTDGDGDVGTGDVPITREVLDSLVEQLTAIFKPSAPPKLSYDNPPCPGQNANPGPATYCPDTNTITVDLPELVALGRPVDESEKQLLQGDNTALSIVVSRYTQALQQQRGLPLNSAAAALRTACYTGVAERALAEPAPGSTPQFQLTAGDLDEAVSGLLTNGLAASDVTNVTVPAGFTRILAFRSGIADANTNVCDRRFP